MRRLLLMTAISVLASCGGGGGGDGETQTPPAPPPPVPNSNPQALAGSNQVVAELSTVTLNGAASNDLDGSITSYVWTQLSGTGLAITNADQPVASVTAPIVDSDTVFVFQLTVTDDDNSIDTDTVTITVQPILLDLAGTISASPGTVADSDVNDPNASSVPNNDPQNAQSIPNPVTLGGYVNVAGAGEDGASQADGDVDDVYRVNLIAGQTLLLFVADASVGDPDLYLLDAAGSTIIDASLSIGSVESLVVPASAEYLVVANAYDGASNYILTIGQSPASAATGGYRLSDTFIPGEAIVQMSPATSALALQSASDELESLGVQREGESLSRATLVSITQPPAAALLQAPASDDSSGRMAISALLAEQQRSAYETLLAIKTLASADSVVYAHPNYLTQALAVPNDEYYSLQWHYPLINLPAAWDLTTGDPSVTVAVLDTGVLVSHPELQGQLVPGFDFISNPVVSVDGDGIDGDADDPGDATGGQPSSFHGTHVAGTIAAASNNADGVAGVAWNARIMPIRVLGAGGGTDYDIQQGILYAAGLPNDSGTAASPPVDVINMSLGGPGPCSLSTQSAITQARQAGVIVVVAAGNDNVDADGFSPASCDGVVTVSAVDINRSLTYYSNFGSTIDIAAPGGDGRLDNDGDGFRDGVLSLKGDDSSETIVNTFGFEQGTSMASPHVAGVMALMRSVNSALTPDQVDLLLASGELTDVIGDENLYGRGLVNAHKAVYAALNAIGMPPVPNPLLGVTPMSMNFGTSFTSGQFVLRNTSSGSLQADPPSTSAPWLSITPVDIDTNNLGTYAVTADRSALADGLYSDTITLSSNINAVQIPVILEVSSTVSAPDAGYLYLLLIDANTGDVVQQLSGDPADGDYLYALSDIDDGAYVIIAGTDSDNDGYICDAGESCGAYRTLSDPQVLSVDIGLDNLDFPVGHVVAIPAQFEGVRAEFPGYRRGTSASPMSSSP